MEDIGPERCKVDAETPEAAPVALADAGFQRDEGKKGRRRLTEGVGLGRQNVGSTMEPLIVP